MFSDFVPDNLVCFQIQIKACSVTLIYGRGLGFIGVIYHTVFAVFNIGMYFHVIVGAEPLIDIFFFACAP